MDVWLLMCMLIVGLAIFEYAICLAIFFGKQRKNKINTKDQEDDATLCRKIDLYSLRSFIIAYNLSVVVVMTVAACLCIQHTA